MSLHAFDVWCSLTVDVLGGCGTFYAILIKSEAFRGLSTIKQHRLVNETLKEEIEGIHGLQVRSQSLSV